ncbi:unnamed protein product [Linum trigynum]|uniref:Uncharacterized protein n=1 Tax=Linum trigynum TaxID=586398 RepID=A0AAV2GEB6_9ROSI
MDYFQLPEDIVVKIARDHFDTTSQLVAFSAGILIAERDSDDHEFSPITMFHTFVATPINDIFDDDQIYSDSSSPPSPRRSH